MSQPSRTPSILALLLLFLLPAVVAAAASLEDRVMRAEKVFQEFLDSPKSKSAQALLDHCTCVAVISRVIKGAFVFGGRHGKGILSCRDEEGAWSGPVFVKLSGGSIGLQIGASSTDFVLFVMSERGARSLVKSEFTLGGDISAAAGPVSKTAEASTDLRFDAEIYSYAQSRGLFAGVSLEGARLGISEKAIRRYYGAWIEPQAILFDDRSLEIPGEAQQFVALLP